MAPTMDYEYKEPGMDTPEGVQRFARDLPRMTLHGNVPTATVMKLAAEVTRLAKELKKSQSKAQDGCEMERLPPRGNMERLQSGLENPSDTERKPVAESDGGIRQIWVIEAVDGSIVKPEWYESKSDAREAAPEATGLGDEWETCWRVASYARVAQALARCEADEVGALLQVAIREMGCRSVAGKNGK